MLLLQTLRISKGVTNLRKKQYQFFANCPTVKPKPVGSLRNQVTPTMVLVQMHWLHVLILEVKTRAAKTEGPLTSLKQQPSYYIQPQLEMVCTGTSCCILESYHPETQEASFFLIKRDDVIISVIKDVTNSILKEKPLLEWSHSENNFYKRVGENVAGRIPDFASIKPLRSHKCTAKVGSYGRVLKVK